MNKTVPVDRKPKTANSILFLSAFFVFSAFPLLPIISLVGPCLVFAEEEKLYTCGMHPQIIQNKPGNCPICGMKLTPLLKKISAPGEANSQTSGTPQKTSGKSGDRKIKFYKSTMIPGEISQKPGKDSMGMDMIPVHEDEAGGAAIAIDPVTIQNMGVRTGVVMKAPLRRTLRTVGVVDFDETTLADVSTKFKGWIEELHVNSTGQQVHRGDPLFEVYSPELYSAQKEFLLASGQGGEALHSGAWTKLKFFDISDEQIEELQKTRQIKKTMRVNAPMDGVVVEKHVVKGQMVEAGEKLYRLADLALVWVQSKIYEQDLGFVRLGQEAVVSLSYLPDRKFRGRVTYIYPTVDEKTRTTQVRMEFHNPGFFLKPGMFATVEMKAEVSPSALLVPDSAVLRSGEKNTVFVALDAGRFEPREVTLGLRSDNDMYEVLGGLAEGERVVVSGQFLLDSESRLREAIQKMLSPGSQMTKAPGSSGETTPQETSHEHGEGSAKAVSEGLVYICPMPEHVAIQYKNPGNCPLCGMALAPVGPDQLAHIQPGAHVEYYTCPLPEHSDLREEKAGKCPRCGMTLIPMMKGQPAHDIPASSTPSHPH